MRHSDLFTPPEGEEDKHAYHTPMEKKYRPHWTHFKRISKAKPLRVYCY